MEIYWAALKPLSIEQVERAAKTCIRFHEHWPRPANLYKLADDERHQPPLYTGSLGTPVPFGLRLVNQMFMQYLVKRRVADRFLGDIRMLERRSACVALANWIQGMKDEDMLPTLDECKSAFAKAMQAIPDDARAEEVC